MSVGPLILASPCPCEFCRDKAAILWVVEDENHDNAIGKYGYTAAEARSLAAQLIKMADDKDAETALSGVPGVTQRPGSA